MRPRCFLRRAPAALSIYTVTVWPRRRPASPRSTRCCASLEQGRVPLFRYRALRPTGAGIAGELVAADEQDAVARLQAIGSYPIEISAPAARRLFSGWGAGPRRPPLAR